MEKTKRYKDRVFYQIWPRSFKDGNGDGMGDQLEKAEGYTGDAEALVHEILSATKVYSLDHLPREYDEKLRACETKYGVDWAEIVRLYDKYIEGAAELVGPSVVTAEGGMCGTYIRTNGNSGKAKLTISTMQTPPVEIEFTVA